MILEKNMLIHSFVVREYFEHEFSYGTYLGLKLSIGAFDCLNITSTALPGCSFVTKHDQKNQYSIIKDSFDHESDCKIYLELKSPIGALDCLNITSVSLLGCLFMAEQGPWSLIIDPLGPDVPVSRSNHPPSSLILDPWYMSLYVKGTGLNAFPVSRKGTLNWLLGLI